MIIKQLEKHGDDGVSIVMALTLEQTKILLNYAIATLTAQGLLTFVSITSEEYDQMKDQIKVDTMEDQPSAVEAAQKNATAPTPAEMADFLAKVDKDKLPQA